MLINKENLLNIQGQRYQYRANQNTYVQYTRAQENLAF